MEDIYNSLPSRRYTGLMCVEDGRCQDLFNAVPPSEKQKSKRVHNSFKK